MRIKAAFVFLACTFLFISFNSCQLENWITIFSTDFEGAFPPVETELKDNDDAINGEYYWSKTSYRHEWGSYSAWAVGAGADGDDLSAGAVYPANAQSYMIIGPYDLTNATAVAAKFDAWVRCEMEKDFLGMGFSTDGIDFPVESTYYVTGNTNGWISYFADFTQFSSDILGQPQVWFAFIFTSDASGGDPGEEGAYIDNVLIRIIE